ncbi:MAG: TetR/AcrR family transcriptional regulator [Bdellovibrionales bacterium]
MSEEIDKKSKYHHGDLYNALIQSGSEVIRSKGLSALSLREVAKKLQVSHTAPYRHFKDKNALMVAIAQKAYDQLGMQMHAIFSGLFHQSD